MSTNNKIKVTDLDYNDIRDNLKSFLKGQDRFSDYDFEGSGMSVLLDVLAYNTHYNALYTNMALNEMFLDSASKRNSIVSIASNMGYLPRSAITSRAVVSITVISSNPQSATETLVLPAYTPFTTTVSGTSYTFYTLSDYTATKDGDTYTFNNVYVYQGEPHEMYFACNEVGQKFTLPNVDIDNETIAVTVQPTPDQPEYSRYVIASSIVDLTNQDEVYYLKEMDDRYLQLSFGTNGLGKEIIPGNIIKVKYLTTKKDAANGANIFTFGGASLAGTVSVITTLKSFGGKVEEDKEEIRTNAAQQYYDQNRAVTPTDYANIIKRYYSDIDSINVWGGEDADPPQYGKVFISIKPASAPYLSSAEKAYITENIIKQRGIVSISPILVDPTYNEMDIDVTVYYNQSRTTRTNDEMKNAVLTGIKNYRDASLQKFDGAFRFSKFGAMIDDIDQSINSNITTFTIWQEVIPRYNTQSQYIVTINNPIYSANVPEESFLTTGFYIDNTSTVYYLDDDGIGNIRMFSLISGTGEKVIKGNYGKVNYSTGTVTINNLYITNLSEPNFYFRFKTESYDVISAKDQIVTIPDSRINISLIDSSGSNTSIGNSSNYTFTSSRA